MRDGPAEIRGAVAVPSRRGMSRRGYRLPYIGGVGGVGISFSSSGFSTTSTSVVSTIEPTLAAFWSADRVTLHGSTIPALNMSTNSPVRTL